jgi:hypothetical protein
MSGWEQLPKHIFILSSSGKPIFSRVGDEQELVTVFGLLQAVVSIVEGQDDKLRCITAGQRRIVYFLRKSLYFIAISSTGEAEAVLSRQLEFMYNQVLLVLTNRVHSVLENDSSKDLRDLLGYDTARLMHAACKEEITPYCIAFDAVQGFALDVEDREKISSLLGTCVTSSGAALGMLLHEDCLISYTVNEETPLSLDVDDVLLLTHFVGNSKSLRTHDQNWVPICLPHFNDGALLQAYICGMRLCPIAAHRKGHIDVSLVLISPDPSLFKELHAGREVLEQGLSAAGGKLPEVLQLAQENQSRLLTKFLAPSSCLHFLFRGHGGGKGSGLAQCFASKMDFPLDSMEAQGSIWSQYQRLALCLRVGSSSAESTVGAERDTVGVLSSGPSPDHAQSYAVLATGYVVVGMATSESELYATFAEGCGGAIEACRLTNLLSRSLALESANLFV